jgi:glutamyl-tRNA reductase
MILDLLSKDVESDETKKELYRIMQKKLKRVQKYFRIASAKIERQHRHQELERTINKFGRQVAELEREYRETREREGGKDEPDEEEIEEDWEKLIKKAMLDTSPLEDWVEIPGQQYTVIIMSFQANFRTFLSYDADLNAVINPCIIKYTEIFNR